jgi:hypothetical protein
MPIRAALLLPSVALALWLGAACGRASAQELARVCNPKKEDCGCERNWGCWDLLYTAKGTLLGVTGAVSHTEHSTRDDFDAGVLTTYWMEHFGTRKQLAGHALLHAAIGGGTAGTEGQISGGLDFGLRLSVSPTSGPFLRLGPSGMFLGHERLQLGYFQPLAGRIGYQVLDDDELVELGATTGMSVAGRFSAADVRRELGQGLQLGGYVALRFSGLRADVSLVQLETTSAVAGSGVWLGRGAICSYLPPIAICVELLDARGQGSARSGGSRAMRAQYSGLTIGLVP